MASLESKCILFLKLNLESILVHSVQSVMIFFFCRYDAATGVFTVPPGGEGYYFFAAHFTVSHSEAELINLRVKGEIICSNYEDTYKYININI